MDWGNWGCGEGDVRKKKEIEALVGELKGGSESTLTKHYTLVDSPVGTLVKLWYAKNGSKKRAKINEKI